MVWYTILETLGEKKYKRRKKNQPKLEDIVYFCFVLFFDKKIRKHSSLLKENREEKKLTWVSVISTDELKRNSFTQEFMKAIKKGSSEVVEI